MAKREEQQTPPDLTRGSVTVPGEERTRCEVWSRVMGYLRPIRTLDGPVMWNAGKVSEWHDRQQFREVTQDNLEV